MLQTAGCALLHNHNIEFCVQVLFSVQLQYLQFTISTSSSQSLLFIHSSKQLNLLFYIQEWSEALTMHHFSSKIEHIWRKRENSLQIRFCTFAAHQKYSIAIKNKFVEWSRIKYILIFNFSLKFLYY